MLQILYSSGGLFATKMGLKTPFEIRIVTKGLAAQSKAEAIGQNKISSANQRPRFQMIFFSFWSGLIYCYELCVYGSKVMIVVEYSVHEQHMNPFICPFPLEKD